MPQMSPIQWTLFFHLFILIMIISMISINFIIPNFSKSLKHKFHLPKSINLKW